MKIKRLTALLLSVCLLASLCACGNRTGGAYTKIYTLTEGRYAIGMRNGDPAADYVEAALKVLSAGGQVHETEIRWFGDTVTSFESDATAMETLEPAEPRTFILGVDPDNFPMSYQSGEEYAGFDVELAQRVCDLLGWELRVQPIGDESDAYVELSSGNVDCVWGGLMLDTAETKFRVFCPYMDADIVVIVLVGNHLGSLRKLADKTVAMNEAQKYADALATVDLNTTAGEIQRLPIGTDQLFDGLVRGAYDAIVTNNAAAVYYMR